MATVRTFIMRSSDEIFCELTKCTLLVANPLKSFGMSHSRLTLDADGNAEPSG